MGFFNFFKPEWQHSNVNVRKEAVMKLRPSADQGPIETGAMNETDSEIRGIAIRKLNSLEILKKVVASETDPSNKRDAENRLLERAAEHLKNFREAATQLELDAVAKVANSRFADDLLKSMPNSELRLALTQATTRQSALEYVALKDPKTDVAMAALDSIERINMLQNIFQNSRHTSVRQKAGEHIKKRKDDGKKKED